MSYGGRLFVQSSWLLYREPSLSDPVLGRHNIGPMLMVVVQKTFYARFCITEEEYWPRAHAFCTDDLLCQILFYIGNILTQSSWLLYRKPFLLDSVLRRCSICPKFMVFIRLTFSVKFSLTEVEYWCKLHGYCMDDLLCQILYHRGRILAQGSCKFDNFLLSVLSQH